MKNKQSKKKEKIVYIDDGSSIADMSSFGGKERKSNSANKNKGYVPRASLNDHLQTYLAAVRMMFLPMLAVLGILALAFLIVYILL